MVKKNVCSHFHTGQRVSPDCPIATDAGHELARRRRRPSRRAAAGNRAAKARVTKSGRAGPASHSWSPHGAGPATLTLQKLVQKHFLFDRRYDLHRALTKHFTLI